MACHRPWPGAKSSGGSGTLQKSLHLVLQAASKLIRRRCTNLWRLGSPHADRQTPSLTCVDVFLSVCAAALGDPGADCSPRRNSKVRLISYDAACGSFRAPGPPQNLTCGGAHPGAAGSLPPSGPAGQGVSPRAKVGRSGVSQESLPTLLAGALARARSQKELARDRGTRTHCSRK